MIGSLFMQSVESRVIRGTCAAAIVATFAAAQPGAAQTLRIPHPVEGGGAASLDPISVDRFAHTAITVYSRLVREDESAQTVPDLAIEWSASEDATQWTFKLREGVTFHNGNSFDAKDVVFSLMRTQSEAIDSPLRDGLGQIESVEALDDLTVLVTLSSPHADFPLLLRDYRMRMLDVETCGGDLDALCESGVGTGPFQVVEYDTLGTTQLARFDDYWEGPAKVEAMEIIAIADQPARVAALQAGQIDIVFGITGQQRPLFEASDDFYIRSVPTGGWPGFAMRTDTPPFDDPELRKALRIGVDRESMGRLVFGEGAFAVSCDHPVWKGDPYRTDIECPADIDGAKAIIEKLYGNETPTFELFVSDVSAGAMKMAEVYQSQMREVGVEIELAVVPSDGYWDDVWQVEPFFVTGWSERPADQILNEAYRSTAPWNETFFKNDEFDAALDAARQELDPATRTKLYGDLQEILWEEGGTLIPFHEANIRAISSDVSNLPDVAYYATRFQDVMKSE